MRLKLIYPRWSKLMRQTEFHLPPHGPVVFAAALPSDVEVDFTDENLQTIDFDDRPDVVGISMMLTIQVKRGWEIADTYRKMGIPVIFGGIATMLHAEDTMQHADAVFLGEAEGRMETVFEDLRNNRLRKVYDYLEDQPPIELVGTARRDILQRELYNYKGVQMVDLVHASRGCRYHCYPCAVAYLGGRRFRPRPIDKTIAEMAAIDNNRMLRGDYRVKPTAYWFVNCEPTHGRSIQFDKLKEKKTHMTSKGSSVAGVCSEERSMISPDYARNFICDFIIGKEQEHTERTLFDL